MGKHLDLDDVAATSELAKAQLAELRSRLKIAEEVIYTSKREVECVTAQEWKLKAMHYEYQWRCCSDFANRRIGETTPNVEITGHRKRPQEDKMKDETAPLSAVRAEPVVRRPIAWGCRTCNKIDWADCKEQLAKPEHVSHRGVDIGNCEGKMIPFYGD